MIISEDQILKVLNDIAFGKIKITMFPDSDCWMGDVLYNVENGWKISVFSDCFSWDYISQIWDENNNLIYEYDSKSLVSEYYCSDDVARNIYKIVDPSREKLDDN